MVCQHGPYFRKLLGLPEKLKSFAESERARKERKRERERERKRERERESAHERERIVGVTRFLNSLPPPHFVT